MHLGHTVVGCGRREELLTSLQVSSENESRFSQVDVTDQTSVDQWAHETTDCFGAPDLLINNAGVGHPSKAFWELSKAEFDLALDINIKGVTNVTRAFLPAMLNRGKGLIIHISSGLGTFAVPNFSAYCASKFAIEGFSKALAEDLPDGLASIALQPGVIDTDILRRHWGEERSGQCDNPQTWAEYAVPYILSLTVDQNGASLRVEQG